MKIKDTKLNLGDNVYILYNNELLLCKINRINILIDDYGYTVSYNLLSCGNRYLSTSFKESDIDKKFFTSKKKLLMEKFGDCFEEKQCLK